MKITTFKCPYGYSDSRLANISYYDNGKYLVSFSEVGNSYGHNFTLNKYSNQISKVNSYLVDFVSTENPNLGREGVVCPYTPGALKREKLYFTVYDKNLSNREESKRVVLDYMDLFLNIKPTSGKFRDFKSIIIILPEVYSDYSEEVIEKVQNELKPYFVRNGLMIGQFYPKCTSPGIRNHEFRPLQSPVPLLVIRYMVKTDYVFLEGYEKEYFNNFKNDFDPKAKEYFRRLNNYKSA